MKSSFLNVIFISLFVILSIAACLPFKQAAEGPEGPLDPQYFYSLDPDVSKDEELEEWLKPYREIYEQEMGQGITETKVPLELHNPESLLGNLAADMIRYRAALEMQEFVHLGLIDRNALRLELPEGIITRRDLYELMPDNSELVILKVTGRNVAELAGEIARKGGAPVSGMRMGIAGDEAKGVLVNAETLVPDRTYYLATTSELADHSGEFESLHPYEERYDFPILIRDLFIDYMKARLSLEPVLDHRIRNLNS
ncbi:MAG: 5'-nucleotidase [Balneolaceae bacterium]